MGLFDFLEKLFSFFHKRKRISRKTKRKYFGKVTRKKVRKKTSKKKPTKKQTRKKKNKKPRRKKVHRLSSINIKKPKRSLRNIHKHKKPSKEKEIGVVTHYFDRISVGVFKLKNPLRLGDRIRIRGKRTDFIQTVDSIQINHKNVDYAKRGEEVGVKVIQEVRENDKVYKVI